MIAAAIVLAAGRGERMGQAKALLRLDGALLLARHVERLRELGCARVLVAVPAALRAELAAIGAPPVRVLGVETHAQGETLALCVRALEAEAPIAPDDRVLVTPVDLRPASCSTLRRLAASEAEVACPRHRGAHGHPLVLRGRVLAPYLTSAPPLDALVRDRRTWIDVDDPATIEDFDTPSDLPA